MILQVLDASTATNMRLAIRPDPYCETDKRAHFQLSAPCGCMHACTGAAVPTTAGSVRSAHYCGAVVCMPCMHACMHIIQSAHIHSAVAEYDFMTEALAP